MSFKVGDIIWTETVNGAVVSGPVTEVSATPMHYIKVDGKEVVACFPFATEAEALKHRARALTVELAIIQTRLRTLEGERS